MKYGQRSRKTRNGKTNKEEENLEGTKKSWGPTPEQCREGGGALTGQPISALHLWEPKKEGLNVHSEPNNMSQA